MEQLGYDKFEQRVFLAYGNGTKTNYTYEAERRRLKGMTAETAAGRAFMDNAYTYDKVNNILNLENKAEVPTSDLMGGSSSYTYEYDDLYRLTTASGQHTGSNRKDQYSLEMSYNTVGGITNKNQFHERSGGDGGSFNEQRKTTYELDYTYETEQPNAPKKIGDNNYSYDANGNQTGWKSDISGQQREILWDEENRIRAIADNGSAYHYVYDASGERVLKGKSTGQAVYKNGEKKAGNGSMGNYTVYVNPYLVLQTGGYTKHYFIEGQRIVSKIGGGIDGRGQGPLKAGNDKIDYAAKAESLFEGIVRNEKFIDEDGNLLTAGKSGKVPPGQIIGNQGNNDQSEPFRYFYHPDHLGSTSYITDATGEVYQHLEYFAFGETFVEEQGNTDKLPYKFNGKELDEETGLYYYGARYYDAQVSIWLALDPKADQMPAMSAYAYSANNPVNLIDPNGEIPIAPIIWWAGRRAAAGAIVDVMVQFSAEWVSGGGTMGQAWNRLEIDGFQVARSAGENLVKGKYTSAALSAAGDMMAYMMDNEDWTWEGAIMAAGEGGISAILGDKLAGELLRKIKVKDGVIFSADLSNVKGKSRSAHRNAANKQLNEAMNSDPNTRELIELYDINALDNTKRSVKNGNRSATRRNPNGTEWDHNNLNKDQIDLRTSKDHLNKTVRDGREGGGYKRNWDGGN